MVRVEEIGFNWIKIRENNESPMKHFYESIKQQYMFDYQDVYIDSIKNSRENGIVVEVGSWIGQSLAFLAVEAINSNKNLKIVSIDAFSGNIHNGDIVTEFPQWQEFANNLRPVWKDIVVIKSLSHLGAKYFRDLSIDFVFIDADHSLDAVRKDLKSWWPKVCRNGIMAGHDFAHPPVRQAIEEFSNLIELKYTVSKNSWILKR